MGGKGMQLLGAPLTLSVSFQRCTVLQLPASTSKTHGGCQKLSATTSRTEQQHLPQAPRCPLLLHSFFPSPPCSASWRAQGLPRRVRRVSARPIARSSCRRSRWPIPTQARPMPTIVATIVHMFQSLSLSMTRMVVGAMAYLIMIIGQPTLPTNSFRRFWQQHLPFESVNRYALHCADCAKVLVQEPK